MVIRKNPIRKGRYWVDIENRETYLVDFDDWLAANADVVKVTYRAQRADPDVSLPATDPYNPPRIIPGKIYSRFYIFEVADGPGVFFPFQIAFPSPAGPEIRNEDDTVQKPGPSTPGDIVREALPDWTQGIDLGDLPRLAVILGLLWLLTKSK